MHRGSIMKWTIFVGFSIKQSTTINEDLRFNENLDQQIRVSGTHALALNRDVQGINAAFPERRSEGAPVMKPASADARKETRPATSVGVPFLLVAARPLN